MSFVIIVISCLVELSCLEFMDYYKAVRELSYQGGTPANSGLYLSRDLLRIQCCCMEGFLLCLIAKLWGLGLVSLYTICIVPLVIMAT